MKKKILFMCGTTNQTTQMHQIANHLNEDYDCFFTPNYADGVLDKLLARGGFIEQSILGTPCREMNFRYFKEHGLQVDDRGRKHSYDLYFIPNDLWVPDNMQGKQIILVQEGLTVPEDWRYRVVKTLSWPRYLANTAMTGLSGAYTYFCVAGEGYAEVFKRKGADPDKLKVTGIPNFDNVGSYENNDFPHHDFVLAATSCLRETHQFENRIAFIKKAVRVANGRQLIFKLHPNENHDRAKREIQKYAREALIFDSGSIEKMIAKCSLMITKYSTVILTALAMNKEIISDYSPEILEFLRPLQNNGRSAENIANLAKSLLRS